MFKSGRNEGARVKFVWIPPARAGDDAGVAAGTASGGVSGVRGGVAAGMREG